MAEIFDSNEFTRDFILQSTKTEKDRLFFYKKMLEVLELNDKKNKFIRKVFFPVIFVDSYKLLLYRLKHGLATDAEIQMLSVYDEINDIEEDLVELYKKRQDYYEYSIDSVKVFSKIPYTGKLLFFKGLSEYENYRLSNISKIHDVDNNRYNFLITEDFLYNSFQLKRQRLTAEGMAYSEIVLISELAGIVHNAYVDEPSEVYDLLCRISNQVFNHIEDLRNVYNTNPNYREELEGLFGKEENVTPNEESEEVTDADITPLEQLTIDYFMDSEGFNDGMLYDTGFMEEVFALYFKMRELNIIKRKTLKNERNE